MTATVHFFHLLLLRIPSPFPKTGIGVRSSKGVCAFCLELQNIRNCFLCLSVKVKPKNARRDWAIHRNLEEETGNAVVATKSNWMLYISQYSGLYAACHWIYRHCKTNGYTEHSRLIKKANKIRILERTTIQNNAAAPIWQQQMVDCELVRELDANLHASNKGGTLTGFWG